MWFLCLALFAALAHADEPMPMQFTPDQIALSLRTTKPPMPAADCAALELSGCRLDVRKPVRNETSIRWVQLDDDPELEAIIVAADELGPYFAYIFDWNRTWNLIGKVRCYRHLDTNFIRVQQITENAPKFIIAERDFSGAGPVTLGYTGWFLRKGRLEQAFEFYTESRNYLADPGHHFLRLLQSGRYLIKHEISEAPPRQNRKHTCEVLTWSAAKAQFVDVPSQRPNFCDATTGLPLIEKSYTTGLKTDTY
jgi:hypothetical protein